MIEQDRYNLPVETARLFLRRVQPGDERALFEIYGDQDNAEFEFFSAWTFDQTCDLVQTQCFVSPGDPGVAFFLAAIERASQVLIGSVQVTILDPEDGQAELGFSFKRRYCGRGYATEAVNAALGYAFNSMDLHRIYAGVDSRNERSWKLMERIGMRREAHFVHANRSGDQWLDDYTYAMLEHEWQEDVSRNQRM